jgi:hypothetical protein
MGLLAQIFSSLTTKKQHINDEKSNYVFYKIVDFTQENKMYSLRCINTYAIFHAKIMDIVYDTCILQGLHPIQACYIGIEYAKYLKKINIQNNTETKKNEKMNGYFVCRYGNYSLIYQDRKGDICFVCKKTGERYLMDPRDIALSEEIISEFDAAQSFHIGLCAGLKLNNKITGYNDVKLNKNSPLLTIVK